MPPSGDVLLALVEDQRLVLEKREAVLQRLLRRFEHFPAEVSLSDDLITERRSAHSQQPQRPAFGPISSMPAGRRRSQGQTRSGTSG